MAIWHFFYESVLATSLRHGLRYDFFQLRDELRNIKIDNTLTEKDEQIFKILDESICQMINSMSFMSVVNYMVLQKKINKDSKVKSNIEKIKALIQNADNKNLLDIDRSISLLGSRALVVNNGGWTIYLILPLLVIFIIALFSIQYEIITNHIKNISSALIYSPNNQSERIQLT